MRNRKRVFNAEIYTESPAKAAKHFDCDKCDDDWCAGLIDKESGAPRVWRSKDEIPRDGLYITTDIPLHAKTVVAVREGVCEWYYRGEHCKYRWHDMPELNEIYGPVALFDEYAGESY
jgi:hypothetical protein